MMAQMVVDKAGDEVVAVVVTRLQAQGQRMAGGAGRRLQGLRPELDLKEVVAVALVDQDRQPLLCLGQQRAGIPLAPARTVLAQVTGESLLAPGALQRIADRRERRDRLVATGVLQRTDQRTVTTHGVAGDAALVADREVGLDQRRQLLHHVVIHAVVACPGLLGGVEVETGTQAEVPGLVGVIRHALATRAGVGRDDDQAELGSHTLRSRLLHEVLVGAGQAAQPVQHRQPGALLHLRRQVHGEHHVAVEHRRAVPVALVPAAETLVAGDDIQGHIKSSLVVREAAPWKPHSVSTTEGG